MTCERYLFEICYLAYWLIVSFDAAYSPLVEAFFGRPVKKCKVLTGKRFAFPAPKMRNLKLVGSEI
jgi:hypothetical protein